MIFAIFYKFSVLKNRSMSTRNTSHFDVIVVGGGHAGIEAAHAAARMGSWTLLITIDAKKIGLMPCNPAVGGVGKGHIVYEISALGGLMPQLCTKTYLQARMLNTRKGPAVQGLRLQIDKHAYSALSAQMLAQVKNLTIYEGMAAEILVDVQNGIQTIIGIKTDTGHVFHAPCVVITTGTFLNGKIHIGEHNFTAGRRDERASLDLPKFLRDVGLSLGRLKTGTPPRLLRDSIDFSKMELQEPDQLDFLFEFTPHRSDSTHACYITHTNAKTHQIIADNLHRSAMYNGNISGIGPRYCPSIEDKIGRFPDKASHHVFVEPESSTCNEIYPNGLSTSLPADVQLAYMQSIAGFEHAIIAKPGYAIEYDFAHPHQLHHSLETKLVNGLFLAGQINGTTGYEEAAGQGIVAGINAHLKAHSKEPFILDRSESYIGIMIDDLVTMGVDEPYRMFTSRAEHRLLLRQDNTFLRLMPKAYELGLIDDAVYASFLTEKQQVETALETLRTTKKGTELLTLFKNPTAVAQVRAIVGPDLSARALLTIQAELEYGPYLERERLEVQRREQYKTLKIPANFVYTDLPGLSKELQQKLNKHKPATIADAALIRGMTPAAISLLIFKIKQRKKT